MTLMRMPLFCWTALCTSILMIFAMPPLTVATALLALDRYLGFHFFTNDLGGNMMNYANLFWLFGHPEVYILILPAFGVYSEVVSTFSTKELYGYTSLVIATMAIAVLSFTVWVHHFFTMGQSANVNAVFGIATMTIGVPTGVKIYDWIWTMFRGRGALHRADALFARLHDDLRAGRPDRHHPGLPAARLSGPQHAVPGRAFPQHADPRAALRDARGLSLLVSQGVRLPARRALGPDRVRLLGGRLLPRLHAALRARRGRAWRGGRRRSSSPPSGPGCMSRASGALVLLAALAALFVQLWVSIRDRDANRVPAGDPWDGARAGMVDLGAAARI